MEQAAIWWKAVSYGLPAVEIVLMGYCLYRLIVPFLERKRDGIGTWAAYTLTILGGYALSSLGMGGFLPGRATGLAAVLLVLCLTDRRNYGQKVFLVLTFFSLHRFASAVAEIIYDNTYYIIENTEYMTEHPNLSFALFAGVCGIYLLSELLFLGLGIWCILKTYVYRDAEMSGKELLVLMTPSYMGMAGYWVIWYYRNFYIAEIQRNSDIYDILSLVYYIVAMITIVAVIALYQSIKAGQEEKLRNELLAVQMEDIRRHIGQVEALYQDIRGIRHDMANHLLTLERLYAVDRTEEAKVYSAQLKGALSRTVGQMKSGNPVTDVILEGFRKEAEQKGIAFRSDFHYPTGSCVDAFDISVMLNNALGNALEHMIGKGKGDERDVLSERRRKNGKKNEKQYIFIRSYRQNNAYMIEICNSFTGTLQWDARSGLPVTSKEAADRRNESIGTGNTKGTDGFKGTDGIAGTDSTTCMNRVDGTNRTSGTDETDSTNRTIRTNGQFHSHGYGLLNIRKVAEKYSGDIAVDLQDGEFRLSILLMME